MTTVDQTTEAAVLRERMEWFGRHASILLLAVNLLLFITMSATLGPKLHWAWPLNAALLTISLMPMTFAGWLVGDDRWRLHRLEEACFLVATASTCVSEWIAEPAFLELGRTALHVPIAPGAVCLGRMVLGVFVVLLITVLHAMRTAIVPSGEWRTLFLTLVISMPIVWAMLGIAPWIADVHHGVVMPLYARSMMLAGLVIVYGVGVTGNTFIAHVIHSLRHQMFHARKLGQYLLEAEIGRGGMGVVYRARHAMLRRRTAVKLLSSTKTSAHAAARFEREAQLCCQLTHPHTVTIYDYGRTPAGVFYYAMELLDGMDVEQLVAQSGPLPAERAVSLLIAACEALREAHSLGLIHRDIKPSNLFVCRVYGGIADFVKVLDFGLAKIQPASWLATVAALEAVAVDSPDRPSSRPSLSLPDRASKPSIRTQLAPKPTPAMLANLSVDGAVLGTPNYTAPEVLRGEPATESSDIYALGAVAYFMLTARTVFGALSTLEVFAAHLHTTPEAPSVHRLTPLPQELEDLILRCLAKSAADRPSSVDELLATLYRVAALLPAWTPRDAESWWSCHAPPAASSLRMPQAMLPLRAENELNGVTGSRSP